MHLAYLSDAVYGSVLGGSVVGRAAGAGAADAAWRSRGGDTDQRGDESEHQYRSTSHVLLALESRQAFLNLCTPPSSRRFHGQLGVRAPA